jgi:SAM-dependent methyltransferase
MLPKPKHLWPEHAAMFKDQSVADAYPNRPPYPAEAIELLASLAVDSPRAVLDVGCGTGDLARPLAPLVGRVDAVDYSEAMIERGKTLPGGGIPSLSWIHSPVETVPLASPYALVTAGESLHWLDWEIVFPRFVEALSPNGHLAFVLREWGHSLVVEQRLYPLFARYSTNRDYTQPYDLLEELEVRALFEKRGERTTVPVPWHPTLDEYVEARHSQNGLSRERMGQSNADAFDVDLRRAIADLRAEGHVEEANGRLAFQVSARVVWGKPTWR